MKLRNSNLETENRILSARAKDTAAILEEAKARDACATSEEFFEENVTLSKDLNAVEPESTGLRRIVSEQSAANVELQERLERMEEEHRQLYSQHKETKTMLEQAKRIHRLNELIASKRSDELYRCEMLIRFLCDKIDHLSSTVSRQGKEAEEGVWRSVQQGLSDMNVVEYLKTVHQAKETPSYAGRARGRGRTTSESMGEATLSAHDSIEGGMKLPASSQPEVDDDMLGGRNSMSTSERLARLERKGGVENDTRVVTFPKSMLERLRILGRL
ncbi:MAG: hypothetical protein Q9184_003519 [Pyrenodesmia sp. 2 TL-2023]